MIISRSSRNYERKRWLKLFFYSSWLVKLKKQTAREREREAKNLEREKGPDEKEYREENGDF